MSQSPTASPGPAEPSVAGEDSTIRSFRVDVAKEALDDLQQRIAGTRWPSRELVEDRSQGVQLATLQELARYWSTEHDWRKAEAGLNALPLFMTHGWPGSIIEMLGTIGPLTDPTAHGGTADDAFDLVLPSLPGYGFSGEPAEEGWDSGRIGRAWAELMRRLGYTRYVAQGGDQGAGVTDAMARQASEGLVGIHLNFLRTALAGDPAPTESDEERAAVDAIATFKSSGFGYFFEQSTRPETVGYAL